MKTAIRIFLSSFLLLVSSSSAQAQRQTKLYIDDGLGSFLTLTAPSGGGALTLPSGGTLLTTTSTITATNIHDDGSIGNVLTSNGGTPHWVAGGGSGVNLQSGTPGTQQTGNINVSGTILAGTAIRTDNINPNATGGTTFGGAVSLASNNLLNVWQLTSHATSAPTGSGTSHLSSVTLAAHSTDMVGQVTFTAASAVSGDAAKVTFTGSSYLSYNTTIVVLTPADNATATAFTGVGYYVNPNTSFFQIVLAAPVSNGTYSFYYHVIAE